MHFNSHAHVERDTTGLKRGDNNADFNSHAHVERDDTEEKNEQSFCISTHTLTWSVTEYLHILQILILISTHTLTWSVTSIIPFIGFSPINFNSHAHVERDALKFYNDKTTLNFNSHAHVERDTHFITLAL